MQQLWERFSIGIDGSHTDVEVTLCKAAFAAGAMAALGCLARGSELDPESAGRFLMGACGEMFMHDLRERAKPAYPAPSNQ